MLSTINHEWKAFEDLAENFATRELSAKKEENDRYPFGPFFDDVVEKAYEVGFMGINLPEDLGGTDLGVGALCAVLYSICQQDASLGGILFTCAFSQEIILASNMKDILLGITSNASNAGEFMVAFPVFSDPSEIEVLPGAARRKNKHIISGRLEYLTLGGLAAHAIIPAKVPGQKVYSLFLVELSDKGIDLSEPVFSLGFHACPCVDVNLGNTHGELLGKEGKGQTYFEEVADKMSIGASAISCGIMKGSLNEAITYAQERYQGGRKIINWSEVRMILADMSLKTSAAEMLIKSALKAMEDNKPGWQVEPRTAALVVQDMACSITTDGIQVLGGYGYMKDYGQEKRFRDAKQAQALMGIVPMKKLRYFDIRTGLMA